MELRTLKIHEVSETFITWFILSERTFSNTPNGRATDVGIPIQDGTFPFRYAILRDLAPTWENYPVQSIYIMRNLAVKSSEYYLKTTKEK